MKFITISFLVMMFLGICSVKEVFSQQSTTAMKDQTADWSALFPVIPGCERVIQALTQSGEVFEQTAIYKREGGNINNGGCGSITFRVEPGARTAARERFEPFQMFNQKIKIGKFDAYTSSPQCGNDDWIGSTAVYFDENKLLAVTANRGAAAILEFAQKADYELIRKSMKSPPKQGINN
jgi:hypothetical protein